MRNEQLFEIRAFDFESDEITSVWYSGDYSMIDLQRILSNEGLELCEHETLELYLDHKWLEENAVVVINDREIMDTPLKELVGQYKVYEMVKELV